MEAVHKASIIKVCIITVCLAITQIFLPSAMAVQYDPQDIPNDLTCGKCGMYPANYPQWQTQIIFTDNSMTAFDGCKCMFEFMQDMGQYDQTHTKDDIARIWVRDFNSGEWIDAKTAHFVIGSEVMGPMGKELIPFNDVNTAATFQKEHGGELAGFDAIGMETLKPLMGKMHMGGKMKTRNTMQK
jgi:copper chaperone NosL